MSWWRLDLPIVGLAIMAAGEVPNYLAGLLPSEMTIRRFAAKDEDKQTLKRSEFKGSMLALGLGLGATLLGHSVWPIIATVLVWAYLIFFCYEPSINNPHDSAKPIDDAGNLVAIQ
jgi:hypothetical protein